jgi:hypothetical protein
VLVILMETGIQLYTIAGFRLYFDVAHFDIAQCKQYKSPE